MRALRCDTANGNKRQPADFMFPLHDFLQTLRGPLHFFEFGFIDGAERNVVGIRSQRCFKFLFIVGGDAEF